MTTVRLPVHAITELYDILRSIDVGPGVSLDIQVSGFGYKAHIKSDDTNSVVVEFTTLWD